jgi:hypothetical protein
MKITRGRIYIQRLFDIADEINLTLAEERVAKLSRRPQLAANARHIELPTPPLEFHLEPQKLLDLSPSPCEVLVRLYDVGAVVITFMIDIQNIMGEDLIKLGKYIAEVETDITEVARPISKQISEVVRPACKLGEASQVVEEYTIFYVQNTEPMLNASKLGEGLDIPRLLLGESESISDGERAQLMRSTFSYRPNDLVCIDWNAAFVLEPSCAVDVPELLELVSVQMLELRAYDAVVGSALHNLYENLDSNKKSFFRASRFARLSRRIMKLYVDVIETTERIDNALTFLGDTYLARVHRAAVAEFGIPHWQHSLRNKLEVLRQINEIIIQQITSQKSLNIEILIAALIFIEIAVGMTQAFSS